MSDSTTTQSAINPNMDLLRFATAGSVDDGKSTLIGRLLLDSKAPWVEVEKHPRDLYFDGYPEESIADWHRRLGLER